ncbi:MAG: M23 family metallopeptidase [Roseburia sp.]
MKKYIARALLFLGLLIFDTALLHYIRDYQENYVSFDQAAIESVIRNHQVAPEIVIAFQEAQSVCSFSELMYAYFYSNLTDISGLENVYAGLSRAYPGETEYWKKNISAVWEDVVYFPVPESMEESYDITFEDSWMQSRSFGGTRGHEGCDIMAQKNERGVYPVVSVSDGVVERMGWLPQGGYRIGIRSPKGAYFYYAHLSDYAEGLAEGNQVAAGELLGFMGDTGYSQVEGTTGNFDVHLHFGIYLNDTDGNEFSINSYAVLMYLQDKRLTYAY